MYINFLIHLFSIVMCVSAEYEPILLQITSGTNDCNNEKLLGKFNLSEVPQFGALCNVPSPKRAQLEFLLENNVVPILCMGLYDVSLRSCKAALSTTAFTGTSAFIDVFPPSVEKFSKVLDTLDKSKNYSTLDKFCTETVKNYTIEEPASNITEFWWNQINQQLKNTSSCKRICDTNENDKVNPLCSYIIWSNGIYINFKKSESAEYQNSIDEAQRNVELTGKMEDEPKPDLLNEEESLMPPSIPAANSEDMSPVENELTEQVGGLDANTSARLTGQPTPLSVIQWNSGGGSALGTSLAEVTADNKFATSKTEIKLPVEANEKPIKKGTQPRKNHEGNTQTIMTAADGMKSGAVNVDKSVPKSIVNTSKPFTVDQAKPGVVDQTKPGIVDTSMPLTVDQAKPGVVDQTKPGVVDQTKPGIVDQVKTGVADQTKPQTTDTDTSMDLSPNIPIDGPEEERGPGIEGGDDDDDGDDVENDIDEKMEPDKTGVSGDLAYGQADKPLVVADHFKEAEDSRFFTYFLCMAVLTIMAYLAFHNKKKLVALAVEGRRTRGTRRRPNCSNYSKLDCSLEEAMVSNTTASVTHVLY